MSEFYCAGCGKKHDDFFWKNKGDGWYCRKFYKPSKAREWVPDYIKDDRRANVKDIIQPFRGGEPSREYAKLYPEQAKKTFSKKELKGAKDVWRDLKGLKDVQETK